MASLQGGGGEMRVVLQIKRAQTGKVDTVELTGKVTEEQIKQLTKQETSDGSHS